VRILRLDGAQKRADQPEQPIVVPAARATADEAHSGIRTLVTVVVPARAVLPGVDAGQDDGGRHAYGEDGGASFCGGAP
jgi:hypothetical protein